MKRIKAELYNALSESLDSPARAASAIGLGAFVAFSPAWGFHVALALSLAHLLRLNKPLALAASMVSAPPLVPFILFASLVVGRFLLSGDVALPDVSPSAMTLAAARTYMAAWVVGSLALSLLAGSAAWLIALAAIKATRRRNLVPANPR